MKGKINKIEVRKGDKAGIYWLRFVFRNGEITCNTETYTDKSYANKLAKSLGEQLSCKVKLLK